MSEFTGLLYARPTALEGAARVLDIGGTLEQYNSSDTPEEADYLALLSDWYAVGEDMRHAMAEISGESFS